MTSSDDDSVDKFVWPSYSGTEDDTPTYTHQEILAMAVGMKNEEYMYIADFENDERFIPIDETSNQWKPTVEMLNVEVQRRWTKNLIRPCARQPKPNLTYEKAMKWLQKYPVDVLPDVTTICDGIDKFNYDTEEKTKEFQNHWTSDIPYLRLMHCFLDESIRAAYRLHCFPNNRKAKGNHDIFNTIANKWNNQQFNPNTTMIPSLHSDFCTSKSLAYELIADLPPITCYKVRRALEYMRHLLTMTIRRWEFSIDPKRGAADFDSNHVRDKDGNDTRGTFLNEYPSYIVYYWHMLNETHCLSLILQRLDPRKLAKSRHPRSSRHIPPSDDDDETNEYIDY
jgi:hypothetical protein